MTRDITRREAVVSLGALVSAAALTPRALGAEPLRATHAASRLKQSVSRWCYGRIKLDDLCEAAKTIGYQSVELLDEADWQSPKKHGLDCVLLDISHQPAEFSQ